VCICVAEPLIDELLLLRYAGLKTYDASVKKVVHVRCELLFATGDLRGMPDLICNMQSPCYNGACHRCAIHGQKRQVTKLRVIPEKKNTSNPNPAKKSKSSSNRSEEDIDADTAATLAAIANKRKSVEIDDDNDDDDDDEGVGISHEDDNNADTSDDDADLRINRPSKRMNRAIRIQPIISKSTSSSTSSSTWPYEQMACPNPHTSSRPCTQCGLGQPDGATPASILASSSTSSTSSSTSSVPSAPVPPGMERYVGASDATYYSHNVRYLPANSKFREWFVQHLGIDAVDKYILEDGTVVGIHDPRVPPVPVKTRESVEALMNEVEDARLVGPVHYKEAVERTGYIRRHVFARLPYFNPVLHYLNDFMHKIYNTVKIIFQYIAHSHFDTKRCAAFAKEKRRFTNNLDPFNDDTKRYEQCVDKHGRSSVKWIDTNAWMKANVSVTYM
jgi:hypothetical protein